MPSHLSPTLPLIKQIVKSEDVTPMPRGRFPFGPRLLFDHTRAWI